MSYSEAYEHSAGKLVLYFAVTTIEMKICKGILKSVKGFELFLVLEPNTETHHFWLALRQSRMFIQYETSFHSLLTDAQNNSVYPYIHKLFEIHVARVVLKSEGENSAVVTPKMVMYNCYIK